MSEVKRELLGWSLLWSLALPEATQVLYRRDSGIQRVCSPLCRGNPGGSAETKQSWDSVSSRYKTGTVLLLFPGQSGCSLNLLSLALQRKDRLGIFTQFCTVVYCCFPDCHVRTPIRSLHSPVQTRGPPLLMRKALAMPSHGMFANRREDTCWERNEEGMGQITHAYLQLTDLCSKLTHTLEAVEMTVLGK